MKITDKINMEYDGLHKYGPITIVALGDSVTHGCFEPNVMDYEAVYWNVLRKRILAVRDYMPVNVICAGIGGTTAKESVERLDTQVINHNPDLVTVCFGLNDVNGELDVYLDALRKIFKKCQDNGIDVIFMTPNMMNTYVADDVYEGYRNYSFETAKMQNEGKMDLYIESAVTLANEMGVTVCDCYAKWKELAKTEDTTMMLVNRINHPTREMHKLFADMLFDTIFKDADIVQKEVGGGMVCDR
ncbi:MAG: GDSL family lipase [Clostridia bacterium]|nr:GDSL family lipase [Clostridia bacterium]